MEELLKVTFAIPKNQTKSDINDSYKSSEKPLTKRKENTMDILVPTLGESHCRGNCLEMD